MIDENSIPFAPFVAINEFMRSEFRLQVIDELFAGASLLPEEQQGKIDRLTRQYVSVQGFRNPSKAPVRLRAKAAQKAFEKHSDFAGTILFGWLTVKKSIGEQIAGLLEELGWTRVLPIDADRSQVPGFYIQWPAGYDFDRINEAYRGHYPDAEVEDDVISLITVLVSMRLPFEEEEADE